MRRAILLFVVLSATAAAQDSMPDTTDWHRYIPLETGNEWHYTVRTQIYPSLPIYETTLHSHKVVGDSLVDSVLYTTLVHCSQEEDENTVCDNGLALVRADEPSASVMNRYTVGGMAYEWPWLQYPCGLSAPFSNDPLVLVCADGMPQFPGLEYYVDGGPVEQYPVAGGDQMTGQLTYKVYSTLVSSAELLSDAGLLSWCVGDPDCGDRGSLLYAILDGVEYGNPVVIVASEGHPELQERYDQLSIFPNPVRSTATLTYTLDAPDRVTLDVFDLQGRKIESVEMGERQPGEHSAQIHTEHWSNGLYQVRITSDRGFSATKGIIVIH